ncbi:hypothetical protein [Nocardioides sp. URHA0032]|uniref:hypothetical protein n=1 Tax=Nocardioides sp. URHA0032 TaxID=1380388 RepID=UPI00048B03CE|nr:hypothetical protein [Nocardioides sp. URHA0032]
MKIAGSLLLGGAFLVALVLSLSPTHVTFLGTEGSCGIPIVTAFQDTSQADDFGLSEQCRRQSVVRFYEAGAVMMTVGLAGGIMLAVSPSEAERQRRQFQEWQAWTAHQEHARQWADYQHRLAEWERQNGSQQ